MKKQTVEAFTINTSGEMVHDTIHKPYPLTKKIGLAVLVITESIVLLLFGWAVYAEKMQESFDAAGYQMIIFASFWGVKAVADNIKAVRGKE